MADMDFTDSENANHTLNIKRSTRLASLRKPNRAKIPNRVWRPAWQGWETEGGEGQGKGTDGGYRRMRELFYAFRTKTFQFNLQRNLNAKDKQNYTFGCKAIYLEISPNLLN